MAVNVNIVCKDNTLSAAAIPGVVVNIYDPAASFAFVASATSDVNGRAAFLLPGALSPGKVYEARFYKLGVIFPNPVQIAVLEPVGSLTNNFTVLATGVPSVLPVSSDPACCRCTGTFLDFANRPIKNMMVTFYPNPEAGFETPAVVNGNRIAADRLTVYTDANGKISVDLLRGSDLNVVWAGQEETSWNMLVPDRSSANLFDLVHPFPVSLSFDQSAAPGNTITVAKGAVVSLPFSVLFSDFETNPDSLPDWVRFLPTGSLFSVEVEISSGVGTLHITGISPGVDTLVPTLLPNVRPVRTPLSFSTPTLTVTVTG
jgi:hypothetical protein